jgi:hypothetical protein
MRARHDHQECGDPDRSDRGGALSGKKCLRIPVDASSSRFRPIMLTAVSTVLGMIQIAPTVFWGANGHRDHGRLIGRDDSNADLSTYIVCGLVRKSRKIVRSFFDSRITNHVKCRSRAGSRTRPSHSDRRIRGEEAAFSNPKPEQSFASAVGESPIFD